MDAGVFISVGNVAYRQPTRSVDLYAENVKKRIPFPLVALVDLHSTTRTFPARCRSSRSTSKHEAGRVRGMEWGNFIKMVLSVVASFGALAWLGRIVVLKFLDAAFEAHKR